MSNLFPAVVRVSPSFIDPRIIIQQNQASGAFDLLSGGDLDVKLGDGDQYVYLKTLSIRTRVAGSQAAYNQLPSVSLVANEISTPTYRMRVRAEYDHHDISAAGNYGVSLPQAQSLGMRQAHFQQTRNALLYGFNPQNGEGLLNTVGATAVNLPADSNGNTTVQTYDNGQMAFFLLAQVTALKTRMYQLGMPLRIEILGPQRILGAFEYQGIVQLTQFQRTGAGTASVKNLIQDVLSGNGDSLGWNYDDTLIGKGAGGADAVLIVAPDIDVPSVGGINTNAFGGLQPNMAACTVQYADMAAPREIPTPLPGGAIDVLSEWRITSGWGTRPEAITIVTMTY